MSRVFDIKSPGFCEWWVWGGPPEYFNTVSACVICLIALYYSTYSHFDHMDRVILSLIFFNGVASAVFHATLYDIFGSLDTLSLLTAVCFMQLRLAQYCQYPPYVLVPLWLVTVTVNNYEATGIDFAFLALSHIVIFLALLTFNCYLFRNDELNPFFLRSVCLFLFAATTWALTEPFCARVTWVRYFFLAHSFFHITTAYTACNILSLHRLRELSK